MASGLVTAPDLSFPHPLPADPGLDPADPGLDPADPGFELAEPGLSVLVVSLGGTGELVAPFSLLQPINQKEA